MLLANAIVLAGSFAAVTDAGFAATAEARSTYVRAGFSSGWMLPAANEPDLARQLDLMADTKATWVRFDFDWGGMESTPGVYDWSKTDRVVRAAKARGLQILAVPGYTPAWARPAGTTDKFGPTDPRAFASFVRAAVARYAPQGVMVWEIWNEPNHSQFWKPKPDPVAYTRLLKAAASAARAANPAITILSAGLSPAKDQDDGSDIAPTTFLTRVYEAGGRGSFDAVGMHPYSFPARPMDPESASWNTFYNLPRVYEVMKAHGDGEKLIWSTEFGAPTGSSPQAVSESEQSEMVKEAYKAIAQWSWTGPLFWYCLNDTGTDKSDPEQNFGLLRHDLSAKEAYSTFKDVMQDKY